MEVTIAENRALLKGRTPAVLQRLTQCLFVGQLSAVWVLLWNVIASLVTTIPLQLTTDTIRKDYAYIHILPAIHGLVLLLYPLFGWIADVIIRRYIIIGISLYLILIGMISKTIISGALLFNDINPHVFWAGIGVSFSLAMLGKGLFEANIIQFGCNQMLEASSLQLSAFIHWYYWTCKLGNIFMYYTNLAVYLNKFLPTDSQSAYSIVCTSVIQTILILVGIVTYHASKRYLHIDLTGHDPIRTVYKVSKYALKHKYPESRSAFTYWEENTPSRIDVGKDRYGGPFTTEEVEDTKTFVRMIYLLMSLFGLHAINSNTQGIASKILSECMKNVTNNTLPMNYIITGNTNHLTSLTILLLIPLYQLLLKPFLRNHIPNMLQRTWFGLVFAILSSVAVLVIVELQGESCNNYSLYLYLLAIPQVFNGIASLLVFLTALEFILAQAPFRMQGLLIGLWYLMDVIDYALLEVELNYNLSRPVYITRLILTVLSLVLHTIAVYFYKYRDRDNVVNTYHLVADKVERTIANERHYYYGSVSSDLIIASNYSINSDSLVTSAHRDIVANSDS